MFIDLADTTHSWRAMHRLYLSFIQPRPIALASTISDDGTLNLAPFSFYNMMSANPPVVLFCPAINRHSMKKDTLKNIETTGEFVIATVTEPLAEKMNICSVEFQSEVSEFEKSGLTPVAARKVKARLVKQSPVNIECRLREVIRLGDGPGGGQVVLGDVLAVHVDETMLTDGDMTCDPAKLLAIGRMGGSDYCRTAEPFGLESIRDPADYEDRGPSRIQESP